MLSKNFWKNKVKFKWKSKKSITAKCHQELTKIRLKLKDQCQVSAIMKKINLKVTSVILVKMGWKFKKEINIKKMHKLNVI